MMEDRKYKNLSLAALTVSLLPLATFIPSILNISLDGAIQSVWAGANMIFVVLGLILSIICVRDKKSRSVVNIISTAISISWLLLMVGIVFFALIINFTK